MFVEVPYILLTFVYAYMLPKKFSEWYLLFAPEVMHRLLTFTCFDLGHGVMTVMNQKGCTFGPPEVQSDVMSHIVVAQTVPHVLHAHMHKAEDMVPRVFLFHHSILKVKILSDGP